MKQICGTEYGHGLRSTVAILLVFAAVAVGPMLPATGETNEDDNNKSDNLAVSNVNAAQRSDGSGLVDIYYDLSGAENPVMISLVLSNDNGFTWDVIPSKRLLSGAIGGGVVNGNGNHIIWDAGRDRAGVYWPETQARVRAFELAATTTITLGDATLFDMVRIPAGSFTMGTSLDLDPEWGYENETPARTVTLDYDFYMGKFPVTQWQWYSIMGSFTRSQSPSGDNHPVHRITWNRAQGFIAELNKFGVGTFRLPSEAEWEYACRAGSDTRWYYGDDPNQLGDYAWYDPNNTPTGAKAVGQKLPNAFGLFDMHGNVFEWMLDRWHDNYNGAPTDGGVWEEGTSTHRVIRGGSYESNARQCRSASRSSRAPTTSISSEQGFRLVWTP